MSAGSDARWLGAGEPVTLDNCAREPIHIPGSIQPHGLLFACRGADLRVHQVSANVERWLGVAPDAMLGLPIGGLLGAEAAETVIDAARRSVLREISPLRVATARGASFDAVMHRSGDVVIIELEHAGQLLPPGPRGFDPRLRGSILRMQHAESVTALCQIAAREVRDVTGFDRVMVYRFDAEWNGEVVAEEKRADLEPFLGLHYPASDIPAQARELYTVNWLRLIADVAYQPVPLVPVLDPVTGGSLDLSHAGLRSVSPIHIEYLRNMGVTASMSVSLVVDGVLAGLIACHHYAGPRVIDPAVRDTAEFLGQSLSWQLRVLANAQVAERAKLAQQHEASIVRSLVSTAEMLDGLAVSSLLAVTDADGAAIVLDEGVRRIGDTPTGEQIQRLVLWLRALPDEVFATDHLAALYPETEDWASAGVLAVAISRELGEYLIWFRKPTDRTIDWAGDPRKVVVSDGAAPPRLSPRGSFALWRENVRGQSLRWDSWHVDAASNLRRVLVGGFRKRSAELRLLNQRLLETDRAKDSFIATVSHELRTPLNAITGWTQLLRSGQISGSRVEHALEVIARNADIQTQIVDDLLDVSRITSGKVTLDVEPVDLPSLIESVLDASALAIGAKDQRLKRIIDPSATPILGDPGRLRQVINNLLTNAIKFTPKGGSITVVLRRLGSDVELTVRDNGKGIAPGFLAHIFEPFRQQDEGMNRRSQGLGLGLAIVHKLVELHGGRVAAESEGEGRGAVFRVVLPMAPLRTRHDTKPPPPPAPAHCPPELARLRILLVEDETDARDLLAVVLRDCGAEVLEAASARDALATLGAQPIELIISDIGMPEMDGLAMIRAIRALPEPARSVPAIALTAYTRAVDRTRAIQAGFQTHIPKPVDATELLTVAASLVGRLRAPA
ncbi:MAG TPA: ATP-binding protein [Kofleriaceae bacterium]|nr:ATP-binding protein [Kofleriaceae bacterium]